MNVGDRVKLTEEYDNNDIVNGPLSVGTEGEITREGPTEDSVYVSFDDLANEFMVSIDKLEKA